MIGTHIIKNGKLLPLKEASIPIDDLAALYGFGVYESIRLKKNIPLFLDEHISRLLHSATILTLQHIFTKKEIAEWITQLIKKNSIETANIKIILLGGNEPTLFAFLLAPKFVEKKEYREGVSVTLFEYERFLPQAKSLNMLPSYIGFTQAKQSGAFDALCIDRYGHIIEGTRSNFFTIKNSTLYTPPEKNILLGITRSHVITCAKKHGWSIEETDIPLNTVCETFDGAFLTNTSSKIVPLKAIGTQRFSTIPPQIHTLRKQFTEYQKQFLAEKYHQSKPSA